MADTDLARESAYARVEAACHVPLLVLSVAMLPLLLWPLVDPSLSRSTRAALDAADYAIWAVFAVEYVVKLSLAADRRRFVRTHLLELALVVLPVLRPLRVLRSTGAVRTLRLSRVGVAAVEGSKQARISLARQAVTYAVLVAAMLLVVGSAIVLDAERGAPKADIRTFGDALWWGVTTMTSVGYGDHVPVSAAGRAIAAVLMVVGVALVSVITAAFAALLVKQEERREDETHIGDLVAQVAALTEQVAMLRAHLGGHATVPQPRASLQRDNA